MLQCSQPLGFPFYCYKEIPREDVSYNSTEYQHKKGEVLWTFWFFGFRKSPVSVEPTNCPFWLVINPMDNDYFSSKWHRCQLILKQSFTFYSSFSFTILKLVCLLLFLLNVAAMPAPIVYLLSNINTTKQKPHNK